MKHILLATIMFTGATAVSAQDGPRDMFNRLDADKSNIVTHAELMAEAQRKFAEFDANNDGIVTLAELPQEMPLRKQQQKRLERIKSRQNARAERRGDDWQPRLSPEEIESRMTKTRLQFMARLDKDGNEQLNVSEFAAPLIKRFKMADADGDGNVTRQEFEDALKERGPRRARKHTKHPAR